MPLHLLGKKSWNVYNQDNIARVRRDEAEAQAREEEEERRMQEVDSERRLQLLKGVKPEEIEPSKTTAYDVEGTGHRDGPQQREGPGHSRKRRRIAGEDDTDREIRYAIEDAEGSSALARANGGKKDDRLNNAPIVDSTGHINLIPSTNNKGHEKNAEAEAEKARKKREYEDQYTMRFSNAAGQKQSLGSNPWYSTAENTAPSEEDGGLGAGKDVWGNEDPRRRQREKARIDSSDPLAAMRKGVKQLKDTEKKRREREISSTPSSSTPLLSAEDTCIADKLAPSGIVITK
ncbi:MAG: hypothetical protein Q9160_006247 [Pyrenula sp. 1 TL-2023]